MMKVDNLCRCCLSESPDLQNIHTSTDCQNSVEVIYNMLTWCFNIQILPDDDLPHTICQQCLETLKVAYYFKKSMENSKKILLDHIQSAKSALPVNNKKDIDVNTNEVNDDYADASFGDTFYEEEDLEKQDVKIENNHSDSEEKYYYCADCPNKFTNPTDLYIHYIKTHKCAKYGRPCDYCNQRFPDFKLLIEHRKKHFHPYVCPVCWLGCYSKSEYTNHICNCTPRMEEDKPKSDDARKMTMCHVCGKSYPTTYIGVHMKIHNEGKISCKYCDKKFKQPSSLGSHIIWNHTKEKKYKCEYCGKMYMTASSRRTHVREAHMKEKNAACETCGKMFFSNARMKKHNLTHTGEKNFICNYCDKSYQTRYGLNVHLKSHTMINTLCT